MTKWALEMHHMVTFKDLNVVMLTLEMLLVHSDDELINSF